MAETKVIQARFGLKYDTYANWTKNNPVLRAGEAAVTVVPSETGAVQQEPAVLVKFGDGHSAYKDLQFMSAKSADVHNWAMQPNKPTYTADEITGLSDYISGQIQDTDTQYQLVRVSDTSFKLQSKPKAGGDWTDVGTAITITYTLAEGTADGTVKFNGTDVKVHGLGSAAYTDADAYDAAGAANGVKTELLGTDGDASTKATIHGVKKYAEEKANEAKTHADSAVGAAKTELIGDGAGVAATTIKGGVTEAKNYTDEQIKVKIAAVYKPAGSTTFAKLPAPTVDLLGNVYDVTDAFTADAKFKAEEQGKKYPAGTNVGVVQDGDGYKYDVLSGMVDLSKHATIEQAQGFATTAKTEAIEAAAADATEKDNAVKTALIGEGNATATTIKGAVEEANTHADGLNTAMDGRVKEVEKKAHTHANKTVLDNINESKVAEWDAKANDADLAQIAKTGKIEDLVQDPGTCVIFDCGSSSVNI